MTTKPTEDAAELIRSLTLEEIQIVKDYIRELQSEDVK